MTLPKDPVKREETLRKYKEAAQKRAQDPEWRRKNKEGSQRRFKNPEHRNNHKKSMQKLAQNLTWQSNQKSGAQKRSQNLKWKENHRLQMQNRAQDPEWRRKNKKSTQRLAQDPEWIRKNKDTGRKNTQNQKWRYNIKEAAQKRVQDPEWRRKNKESNRRLAESLEWRIKQKEGKVGGFWYGNVRYTNRKYCELWCPDLWHRIDKAQNYQSILSGKTKFDNGERTLDRHHVYWQPKACCEWDEDTQGYFAMINIGTRGKPNWYKHYITGDPNKFVLLTKQEHGMVAKDKLKWIKIFENLIETKLGGVCYLPEDEE